MIENGSCTGKTSYLTWDAASKAMSRGRFRRNDNREGQVTVYRCRICSGWHIGKSKFGKKRG